MQDASIRKRDDRPLAGVGRQAVVDIGSNSVRLVIFDGPARSPMPICNEKALCGLGRDMTEKGELNPAAADYALATLTRFRRLIAEHGDPPVRVFATAAVREAADGKAFVKQVTSLGFDVDVIDGGEEALLAALGVVSYEPGATGIVGDMGGGSLELVALKDGAVEDNVSLSIGPLRLMQQSAGKAGKALDLIGAALDGVDWLKAGRFDALYSVGGAWRALARIHMRLRSYPLSILHHYEFSRADAISICELIARQTSRSLQEIPGIPRRRLDTLPFASLAFKALLQRTAVQKVVISAGGVREGLLYKWLPEEERRLDPLLESAGFFADRLSPEPSFGKVLVPFTEGLFEGESAAERRVRAATCRLADIGAYFHPDLRAMQAFDTSLRAPFYGVTHTERIAVALSLHCRHDGRAPALTDEHLLGLLTWEERQRATRLGLAMRFAGALAPKAPHALAGCSLTQEDGRIIFRAPEIIRSLMGELPRKRLEALASAFDAAPDEDYY